MKTVKTSIYTFDVNGMQFKATATSKFAAKKKLKLNPDVPDGPILFIAEEPVKTEQDKRQAG